MKPKLILCLALVLCGLFGCSPSSKNSISSGLTCDTTVPSLKPDKNGMLYGALILKNNSSKPIRVCTLCGQDRDRWQAGYGFDIILNPERNQGDTMPFQQMAASIKTLQSGESIDIPFGIPVDTNSTMRITAHYEVYKISQFYGVKFDQLDMWRGRIDAKPITIKIER
jgi:hypothetical protein